MLLYLRMIIILGVTLFTSRVILQTLGVDDYGIYNVVGGVVTMFSFISASLATASQRFITFELGKGGIGDVSNVFSTCLYIHILLAIVIAIIIEPIGLWFIKNKLMIPEERLSAAIWVFHFSILSMAVMIIGASFNALIIAHESMNAFALVSIVDAGLRLGIAYSLLAFDTFDRLIIYGLLIFLAQCICTLCYALFCKKSYKNVRYSGRVDRILLIKMAKFASWSVFGNVAFLTFAWTYDEPGNGKSRSHEVSASIGTSNDFRLSDAWAINLDVRGMFVNDRFDGEMGHRWGEGVLSATIGLTYNIAPRGWNKSKTVVKTVNNNIADFQKALSESEAERIRLEKELGELRAQPQIVEKQTTIAAPYFVIFEINKSKLSKDSRVNLGMLAEIIKANNIKYIVTGYADAATGNKKINDKLSRKRAVAVYECLTKEFGVPESLLEIGHKGGVENMFYDDPALSRAAITKAL